jgi:sugar lactone lactonase YvrE
VVYRVMGVGLACLIGMVCAAGTEGLDRIVPEGAEVVKVNVDQQFSFTEGPCWDGKDTLYFSDIPSNRIMKLLPDGTFTVFREPSDAANGLMIDAEGNLISCDGGARRVTMLDRDGTVKAVLAERYDGKRLNSPNDLVIDSKGGIYFTDPRFGSQEGLEQDKEAVYYRRTDGTMVRVIEDMVKPNGVILSPDETTLYVGDSAREYIRAYDVQPDGTVTNGRDFGKLPPVMRSGRERRNGADGLTMDVEGTLYVAASSGIEVFDKNGNHLGVIEVPEQPANCTFGGADYKTMFITARTSLYRVRLKVPGVSFPVNR